MINLTRTINGEKLQEIKEYLNHQKSLTNGSYNTDDIVSALEEEFYSKCYICEDDKYTSMNIEHFIPHQGEPNLKFDWDNLYLACAHCNGIKLDDYDNILDCMCEEDDVELSIKYIGPFLPRKEVIIEALSENEKVKKTAELLMKVYNGTTAQKKLESFKLRRKILTEMIKLQTLLLEFYEEAHDQEDKEDVKRRLKRLFHKKSPFLAFKKWVILEEDKFVEDFSDLI